MMLEHILVAGLALLALVMACASLRQTRNRSSMPPSPTPTSTPSTPSESLEIAKMMMKTASDQMTQTTKLLELMMVGREPTPETSQTSSIEQPQIFDPDSTPLSPGIEAVISRELEEDQLEASLKERAVLQERMRELLAEQERQTDQSTLDDRSPGPWSMESESESQT